MKRAFGLAALALVATLLLPVTASADSLDAASNGTLGDTVPLNTLLVFMAAVLVLFMQAGLGLRAIGFMLQGFGAPQNAFGVMGVSDATIETKWLFQFAFCAVSLAIVWGTTLERINFVAYVAYAIVFVAVLYPSGAHWVFGGVWLQNGAFFLDDIGLTGMQDFAGS